MYPNMNNIKSLIRRDFLILATLLFIPFVVFSQTITFDDTDPEIMVLDNGSSYELAFHKLTGAFSYIKDMSVNVELTSGETFDDIWTMDFMDGSEMHSSAYYPGQPNDFSYTWNDSLHALSLIYTPDSLADIQVNATVTVALSDSAWFDMQIHIENEGDGIIKDVEFPRSINMLLGQGDGAYFAFGYPGFMFGSDFFDTRETEILECDYISFDVAGGSISIYQLYNDTCIQAVESGLFGEADSTLQHNYHCDLKYFTWIETGNAWTSQVSRIRIGQTSWETIKAFRQDNGVEEFPSIKDKLGSQFDLYARSPVYGHSPQHWDPPAFYYSDVPDQYETYPVPAIFFLNQYIPARCQVCQGYSPDYYPPESLFGTVEDFLNMIDTLQSRGYLVMMNTLQFLWDVDSPTMKNLPDGLTIEDIAQLKHDGTVQYYSQNPDEPAFAVSPSSPFVQQKFEDIYDIIFNIYGAEMIFEDGALPPSPYDFNKHAEYPIGYRQQLLDYYKERKDYRVIPENNYLPMVEFITGSLDSNLEGFRNSGHGWDYERDDGYWRPFPLVSRLYNDKTITFQGYAVVTEDKDDIAENVLFGCPFQIDLDEMSSRPYWEIEEQNGWIPVIHEFQGRVTSRVIGKQMKAYADLEGPATLADYGDMFITRNWDTVTVYNYDNHNIAPRGIYAWSESGDLEAGILTRFNGADLSPGDHYLIVETFEDSIEIRHPMGDSTSIEISRPEPWIDEDDIHIYSITKDSIKELIPSIEIDIIQFQMKRAVPDNSRILKYLILYGDTLQVTKDPEPVHAINENQVISYLLCYPNPYTQQTRVAFNVTDPGEVTFRIYDHTGKMIRVLLEDLLDKGEHAIVWDGNDQQGLGVSPGLYILECILNNQRVFKKILKL